MGTRWVPFCVMAFTGNWCWPRGGACCRIVTVVSGAAWELWMMWLTPPKDEAVMDGCGSTWTVIEKKRKTVKLDELSLTWHQLKHEWPSEMTFEFLMVSASILLMFWALCWSRLTANGCHANSRYLVNDVHSLHDRGGANCCCYNGWSCHGVGHRLHGCLRQWALHGNQDRLAAEGRDWQSRVEVVRVGGGWQTHI